ncbi:lysozyme family protein [Peribacillus kribbensis]|uniref:lysozyme family protein n=1 Tax=Peribacillus kribbensis TaxID=356658 RepID=UPI00040483BE|nr:lysozyme family protein [Peribacillus kribbensis]
MKKRKNKRWKSFLILAGVLLLFLAVMRHPAIKSGIPSSVLKEQIDPFKQSRQYTPLIESELKKYGLEEYTMTVVALMQQETKGKGGDPMQASESAGLPPNTINSPEKSIQQGIKHFNSAVTYGKKKNVDFPTIIQAYNMGTGYINYVSSHGGKHSEVLAKQYSIQQVKKQPKIYNCKGDKNNFRYPYCYGDFTYTSKVEKNLAALAATGPARTAGT